MKVVIECVVETGIPSLPETSRMLASSRLGREA